MEDLQILQNKAYKIILLSHSRSYATETLDSLAEGGVRVCSDGFALFLVRFCGNFHFNSWYCGFKTLNGLRLLQLLSRGFR